MLTEVVGLPLWLMIQQWKSTKMVVETAVLQLSRYYFLMILTIIFFQDEDFIVMQCIGNDAEMEGGVNDRLNGQGWHNSAKME